jgi:uncharacterized coiled-coil DUF342 family protein
MSGSCRETENASPTDILTLGASCQGTVGGSVVQLATGSRKSTKELAKMKKREDKGMEHVMKALQSLESTDEKLSALCRKYTELLEEHKTMQNTLKQTQRTLSVLAREKDQLQNDHSKAVLAKSKLEGLCRELQRHNRLVKDESAARAKEDEDKRKEVAAKFQTTINEIQQQMNEHYQRNSTLREENLELTNKLKGLIEQYELREQHIEKVLKHKDLESQLYDAKLAQATLQLTEEKERNLQEKQQLLEDALENQKRVMLLTENEKQLKVQVAMYQEKYEEFQQTLTKSNDVFQNFKSEMDKMTKKIKKLEKETAMYRQRWESSNKALLTMAEEKTRSEREVSVLQNKVAKLESLCRALQEERRKNLGGRMSGEPRATSVEKMTACESGCHHHHHEAVVVQQQLQSVSPSHQVASPSAVVPSQSPDHHGTDGDVNIEATEISLSRQTEEDKAPAAAAACMSSPDTEASVSQTSEAIAAESSALTTPGDASDIVTLQSPDIPDRPVAMGDSAPDDCATTSPPPLPTTNEVQTGACDGLPVVSVQADVVDVASPSVAETLADVTPAPSVDVDPVTDLVLPPSE